MIKIFNIISILFLIFLFQPSWAQFNYSKKAQEAHNAILDLNFAQYNNLRVNQTQAEKGIFLWLDGYKEFINLYTTSNFCDPNLVIDHIQSYLTSIEKLPKNDPFYYYTLTDLRLFLSFLYFEQNEPVRSLQNYLIAKTSLTTCREEYPDFEYANKQLLVQFVVNNLINQQFGIKTVPNQEMQKSYIKLFVDYLNTKNSVYSREIKLLGIFLFNMQYDSQIEMLIKDANISIDYAKTGPIETLASAMIYKKADYYSDQLTILNNSDNLGYQKKLNILSLWYGNALLNKQIDTSIVFINKFLTNQQNQKFVPYAHFKASMYWYLKGDTAKSDFYNKEIKQSTLVVSSEDRQALYEINHAKFWTKELVLARVLFDGGEFKRALDVLLAAKGNVAYYTHEQKLEYSYRIARIYDKFKDIEKAKKFYIMVINSKLDDQFYYPAYAAFYLGNLYAEKDDFKMANEYFTICQQLNSPIYKNSIHKKAKQAIN